MREPAATIPTDARPLLRGVARTWARTASIRATLTASAWVLGGAALNGAVQVGRILDDVAYPRYRRHSLTKPVLVLAMPRSGTTFLHRLLALDPQFAALTLRDTLLPSTALIRATDALQRLDGRLGGHGGRLLDRVQGRALSGWDGIHETGLQRTEEDEMLWMHAVASPAILFLLFPWPDIAPRCAFVDDEKEDVRNRLAGALRASLRRIAYATGPQATKTLLLKNALAGGRIRTVLQALPDARVVYLVRHPYDAIPSALSMFARPLRAQLPGLLEDGPELHAVADLLFEYARRLDRQLEELDQRSVTLRYDAFVRDPASAVGHVYESLGLEPATGFQGRLVEALHEARGYRSRHTYSLDRFGLTRERVQAELPALFARHGLER